MSSSATNSRRGYLPIGTNSSNSFNSSLGYSLFAWAARKRVLVVISIVGFIFGSQIFLLGPSLVGEDRLKQWGLEEWHRPLPWQKPPQEGSDPLDHPGLLYVPPDHHVPPSQNQPEIQNVASTLHPDSPYPFPDDIPASSDSSLFLSSSSFPAQLDPSDRSSTYSNFSKIYPFEDPHRGEILEKKLRVLQNDVKSIGPSRPPTAPLITLEMWNPPRWSKNLNGSRTSHLDTVHAAKQDVESDWRTGKFNGWKPPLEFLANTNPVTPLPKVQFDFKNSKRFSGKDGDEKMEELIKERRRLVKNAFLHAWEGYKRLAWGHDELKPVSEVPQDNFNGWGATIVDALDTLLVMDLPHEYDLARQHVRDIDFHMVGGDRSAYGHADGQIPVFETSIRYLGGFLSAYDLSGDVLMRDRAEELAQLIMPSFDTLTGVPIGRLRMGVSHGRPIPSQAVVLAEAGSMLLEFTRLWQVTGNRTYFDKVQRTTDWFDKNMTLSSSRLGTLFPTMIQAERNNMYGWYTFGGMADSYYEYLIKEHQLLGGRLPQYSRMYSSAIDSAVNWLMRNIRTIPGVDSLLVIGQSNGRMHTLKLEHLSCFSGGMLALGSKLLPNRLEDLVHARRFTETCWWAYNSTATGIGPEDMVFYKPTDSDRFKVSTLDDGTERRGSLKGKPIQGVRSMNGDYKNRPETIESVLYMYRITGDPVWQERGWQMFSSWVTHCMTNVGFSSIQDVNRVPAHQTDSQESFTFAETFKYYYLLFSPPELISLDDYVFTTEAHPLLLPKKGQWPTPGRGPRSFWNIGTGSGVDPHVAIAASGFYTGGEGAEPGTGTNGQKQALYRAWDKKHSKGTGADIIARELAGLGAAGKEAFKSALGRLLGVTMEITERDEGLSIESLDEAMQFLGQEEDGPEKELRSLQDEDENLDLEDFHQDLGTRGEQPSTPNPFESNSIPGSYVYSPDGEGVNGESIAGSAAAQRIADQITLGEDDEISLKTAAAAFAVLTGHDEEELLILLREQFDQKMELATQTLREMEEDFKKKGVGEEVQLVLSPEARQEMKKFEIKLEVRKEEREVEEEQTQTRRRSGFGGGGS